MNVTIDPRSGFCWGVVRTVQIAEETLESSPPGSVYVLGNIIHNPREIERLAAKGLKTLRSREEIASLPPGAKVLIRAHGEPPETYRLARQHRIEIIDATCPVVTKLQERVRKFYDLGYQIVIFGKRNHAEVVGVRGVCNDECIVVERLEDALEQVDVRKKTVLFSQTTMDRPTFLRLRDVLKSRIEELIVEEMGTIATEFHAKDTICGQVSGREDDLRRFARQHDVVIFVAGKESSNGKVLFDVARSENPQTYFIEDVSELQSEWFEGAESVGITGATSTPQWYMQQVRREILRRVATASAML
ncbi:MAG: 4-hydroxy-3-methylbut-2-enyl diphosphate reductase [Candidatus Kapaibacterium sp.]|nr:MAG: 4-hydroxy-3-methylbut-2-enyl diphosphate reductase [Candidatus Kapabacteria bacterium]GIV55898.1 MAG: 4-hydroxy-3-methylbut-2-enyl diphosphate reductase [Candidatus Kapabacteria bacterium]